LEEKHMIHNEDCITGMESRLAPDSIDLLVTSIPFGALFMYSGKPEDVGNNPDGVDMRAERFGLNMRFWIQQVLRVMRPGRNVCIHIQQLLRYQNQHGYMGRRDFRGAVIDLVSAGGLEWVGEIVIPKNPQAMAQRLSLHSLMFVTGKRDAAKWAPAVNDYILIFQKPGENQTPIPSLYDAEVNPGGWMTTEEWILWAEGVWDDGIIETDVLDGYRSARETDEERHVCPLQLEVIRRLVSMYSNPGEVVMDPFMGIGSTAYVCAQGRTAAGHSLRHPRRYVGFELKESYHNLALRNLEKLQVDLADRNNDLLKGLA
jgi:DNA modification methylase